MCRDGLTLAYRNLVLQSCRILRHNGLIFVRLATVGSDKKQFHLYMLLGARKNARKKMPGTQFDDDE